MRAVTVTEYGATPAVAEMPTPQPGPGQVLIRLRAAGMNPMDRALASGAWKPMPATFPMVPEPMARAWSSNSGQERRGFPSATICSASC